MASGYLHLLLKQVSRQLDYLHSVKQRLRKGRQGVGRSYEEHLRQVVVDINIIVVEMTVLLRVEHFKQCRRRITLEVGADFVDLIKQKHRVGSAGAAHGLHDAAGHRTDICAAMTAYLGLVVQTAERHTLVSAAKSRRDCGAERRLAHSGRAYQTEDRRLARRIVDHHGYLFEHTLLNLAQTVVGVVEYFGSLSEIFLKRTHHSPRERQQSLKI